MFLGANDALFDFYSSIDSNFASFYAILRVFKYYYCYKCTFNNPLLEQKKGTY